MTENRALPSNGQAKPVRGRLPAYLKPEPSREGAPGGLNQSFGFPLPPLKFRTAGFPQYGFKWTVNGDLRRQPEA